MRNNAEWLYWELRKSPYIHGAFFSYHYISQDRVFNKEATSKQKILVHWFNDQMNGGTKSLEDFKYEL